MTRGHLARGTAGLVTGGMAALCSWSGAASAPPGPPAVAVRWVAPVTAIPGDLVSVEVWADGAAHVAAYEVVATLDPGAGRIEVAAADEAAMSAGVREDISISDLTGYGVLAAYSPTNTEAGTSSTHLGTFMVRFTTPGAVELRLGAATMVDRSGAELAVEAERIVSVRVATGPHDTARRRWPAPPLPWALPPQVATPTRWPEPAVELQLDWQAARLDRQPCGGGAARQAGGCVDIGDVQRLAAAATTQQLNRSASAATSSSAGVFVVNDAGDASDRNIGNGTCATSNGKCTLRAAMQEANAMTGANTIAFALPGSPPYIIQTSSRLPALSDSSGGTTIDGYTQLGATRNTDPIVSNADVVVQVVGSGPSGHDGFAITTGNNVIDGLSIYKFRRPVWVYRTGRAAPANVIKGSMIGTDPAGNYVAPGLVDLGHGIHIEQDSANTIIGGTTPADRNVISGNARHGVGIWHNWSDNTVIRGNVVGLSPLGDRRVPNRKHGLDMNFGASGTVVGGTGLGERNLVSGNDDDAVEISHTSKTTNNRVVGNLLGTDASGNAAGWTGNKNHGVWIEDAASYNVVEHNVIGGNANGGVRIINGGTNGVSTGNVVRDNWIGISPTGAEIPNGQAGVLVEGSDSVIGPNNRIAGQPGPGIVSTMADAQRNTFTRNVIYGNGGLSIDLAPRGKVNLNDPGDTDSGPNTLLNYPVITSATSSSVTGTACSGCTVEVFSTGTGGAGHGPARAFIGSAVAAGNGSFTVAASGVVPGSWITSTATDPAGNTSELSVNHQVG